MIRAIIVDDEKPTLNRLKRQINDSEVAEVVKTFSKSIEVLEFLKDNPIDVAFLDIEMPGINGLELASRINDIQPLVNIVFITAYNQYAVEAFRLNAIDYLLKPVTNELLKESLMRVVSQLKPQISNERLTINCFGKFSVFAGNEKINFRTEKTKELLAFLITQNGTFVSRETILDSMWEEFDGDRALINFNSTLYNLRKALINFNNNIKIVFESGCYRIFMENVDCDYLSFCKIAQKKEPIMKDNKSTQEKVLSLYSGEYLAGINSFWVMQKKFFTANIYVELIIKLVNFYLVYNDKVKAYTLLINGLTKEPVSRELNYYLIKLFLADNEKINAERYYNAYKDALLKQFKETPDSDFKKLMKN